MGRSKLLQHGRKIGVRIVFVYCLKGEWERVHPLVCRACGRVGIIIVARLFHANVIEDELQRDLYD